MDDDGTKASDLTGASALPIAPSLEPSLSTVPPPPPQPAVDARVVVTSGLAMVLGALAAVVADLLTHLIGLITNIAYYGRLDVSFVSPSTERLGAWSVLVP